MNDDQSIAPGWPGIEPRWTSSAKSGVGTAANQASRVWFTLSHGILNEIYYPRIDLACTRDLGLLVTDGATFFSEEKRHARHDVAYLAPGVPAYRLTNTCLQGRYWIEKIIISDPTRDVVLQQIRFTPRQGTLHDYHLYALLAPHLGNHGKGNTAWVGDYKGTPMLFAQRVDLALALACSTPWLAGSAGYVGFSDGWQDVSQHKTMTWHYARAEDGNVALIGEIDLMASGGVFVLALGFGLTPAEAGVHARASLLTDFSALCADYRQGWQTWQAGLLELDQADDGPTDNQRRSLYRISTAVMGIHEAKRFPGGHIASLSIPWGFAKGDNDLGGYHLVWPRDLVETAGGLLAAGAHHEARQILHYLAATQEPDGHWTQNMWLDGTPYWHGLQMDESAFPILLVDLLRREGALDAASMAHYWPVARQAAAFLVRNGPVTQQDRWEEDPGYSPFTLAVEISALLAAADLAESQDEAAVATYLRETADQWNANIERWCYVTDTALARQLGVTGYYVRIAPPDVAEAASPQHGFVPIKNRPPDQSEAPADQLVSPDALALVRFGLRAATDPRMVNTVQVIDALLKVETPCGPVWHRYNADGYGEQADGAPFDGTGEGRGWPLLTGERAHYELAAGRTDAATRLLHALEHLAADSGLLPEQSWDSPDLPERELYFGRPAGSAMPLVWAHAEYVKLCRSLREGAIFDRPPQPVQRYQVEAIGSPLTSWRFNHKCRVLPVGQTLRIELLNPAVVRWSSDGWQTTAEQPTHDTGLDVHIADLPTASLPTTTSLVFTFYWLPDQRWEQHDYTVQVGDIAELPTANQIGETQP